MRAESMANDTTLAKHFADLAKHFRAKARNEKGRLKAEWEHLADCYSQIANKSDRDSLNDSLATE
jgi:hypothetical protein